MRSLCLCPVSRTFPLIIFVLLTCSTSDMDSIEGWTETNGVNTQNSQYSSSNSNSSSLSGMSSSSSESDFKMASAAGDYGADADSLTCKQSDISSSSHLENDLLNVVSALLTSLSLSAFHGARCGDIGCGHVQFTVIRLWLFLLMFVNEFFLEFTVHLLPVSWELSGRNG